MRIANWNERTFYTAGEMNELVKGMDNYERDVRVLQEMKWPWKGTVIKKIII